jgi:hypothetical protein
MKKLERTTTRDYRNPYRPRLVKAANAVGRGWWKLLSREYGRDITAEELLRSASRKERLDDFGEPDFSEPLKILLDSINRESRLTPFGKFVTRTRLTGVLRNRLRVRHWLTKYPEILDIPLPEILVITGFQRTGTTMLHRLLASDPDTRALLSWEALEPAPYLDRNGGPVEKDPDPRMKSAETSEKALGYLSPDFFAVHPVEADAPEEDVLLLDFAFLSTVPEATLRVPSYSRWLEVQDQTPAYRYMEGLLKLLLWQRPKRRWVLKTPHHMEFLDALFTVFPQVKIIHTHRDPRETLASFASMISHGRGVFSDRVDPVEVGRDWTRKIHRMMLRSIMFRDKNPDKPFIDVYYEDLLEDPLAEVERIYDFAGIELTDDARERMETNRKTNRQYRYGRHEYRLEDFGLTPEGVRREFEPYYERYLQEARV